MFPEPEPGPSGPPGDRMAEKSQSTEGSAFPGLEASRPAGAKGWVEVKN